MSFRPLIDEVTTPAIRTEGSLKIEPQYRPEMAKNLSVARQQADVPGMALAAFTLAYSYDHYAPYDFEQSHSLLGEALTYYPDWPEGLFNRGVVHIHLGKFQEAIQDFEQAERAYDKAVPIRALISHDRMLTKGKLLIFQAEAYCGRSQPGDLELARTNLVRAESYLLKIIDPTGNDVSARFWIDQIPGRLKSTIPPTPKQESRSIHHPAAFLIGLIMVPFMMWWLVYATTPKPPSDTTGGDESKQKARTEKTQQSSEPSSKMPSSRNEKGNSQPEFPKTPVGEPKK
jgi:tetratricopeptide (TPR) repeat protein